MIVTSDEILKFWFEGINDQALIRKKDMPFKKWFYGGKVFDEEVCLKFGAVLEQALSGSLKDWENTPRGMLALIVLFDQLSRNVFRNTARMYDGDQEALRLSSQLIERNADKEFLCIERLFIYMPLMHAENMSVQKFSVDKFKELAKDILTVNPANKKYYLDQLVYAEKYCSVIGRFGRFPRRNNVLGRSSSTAEAEFFRISSSE